MIVGLALAELHIAANIGLDLIRQIVQSKREIDRFSMTSKGGAI
jgi:hypothetical protein